MIVDGIGVEPAADGRAIRTARMHVEDGRSWPMDVVAPMGFLAAELDDATAAVPLALLLAMKLGENLEIRGHVDAKLLERVDDLQAYYLACGGGSLRPVAVGVVGSLAPSARSPLAAACLSRGVDSLYQAARRRSAGGPLDALLFVDRFEPIHDERVRAQERALALETAAVIGLPLVMAEASLRDLSDTLFDWEDAVGAGLAWVAHALAGGLGRLVIPATDSIRMLAPCGVGPALEPLFCSSRMQLEAGDVIETRMGKVAWLARCTPELLPFVKVCFAENRADNCGRCGKCLHTMACLRAAGALEQATAFPAELDLDGLAVQRSGLISVMAEFAALRDAAAAVGDKPLADAATEVLKQSTGARRAPRTADAARSFRARHSDATLALLRDARWPPELGLVRAIDLRGRRHIHGAGWRPAGSVTAELGALLPRGSGAQLPLWILADGRIATREVTPVGAHTGTGARIRHAAAPLFAPRGAGLRRFARRALDLAVVRPQGPAAPDPKAEPAGYLHAEALDATVPLWVGEHPTTGDQYSANSAQEVLAAGYTDPRLVGHLEAHAPVTGWLGVHATPIIPWV